MVFCVPMARAGFFGDLFDGLFPFAADVFSAETVCEPDVFECPSGALVFRDKNHDCEFTPCELLPASPTPAPTNPRSLNASGWYRHREFIVPQLRYRDAMRGKRVAAAVVNLLLHKARRCSARAGHRRVETEQGEMFFFLGCIDMYLIENGASSNDTELSTLRTALLGDTLSPTVNESTPLVVAVEPWSRWSYYGQVAKRPTKVDVETVIAVELARLVAAAGVDMNISMFAMPVLCVEVNGTVSIETNRSDEAAFDWMAHGVTTNASRDAVIAFIELRRQRIVDFLTSVASVHNESTSVGQRAAEMAASPIATTVFVTRVGPDFGDSEVAVNATSEWIFRSTCADSSDASGIGCGSANGCRGWQLYRVEE